MNSKMIGSIADSGLFDKIYVPQIPSDGGLALGSAFYVHAKETRLHGTNMQEGAYLGPKYASETIKKATWRAGLRVQKYNLNQAASLLSDGKVIAFCSGRSELGPRTLGARSIIAKPNPREMRDLVNSKIKFRESYTPFAPVIRDVDATEYFHLGTSNLNFMGTVCKAKAKAIKEAPAIVHVDGTSRVQALSRTSHGGEQLYDLLSHLKDHFRISILLNTSFNLSGDPIVESPTDAIRTFV